MPAPAWNFAPQKANGNYAPGFDRRPGSTPDYTVGWSPPVDPIWPRTTEAGGGMLRGNNMNGMGDFFTLPQGQQDMQAYYEQQIQSGGMAPPPISSPAGQVLPPGAPFVTADPMDESGLYMQSEPRQAGLMPWERGPAPWEQVPPAGLMPSQALSPDAASAAIVHMNARKAASGEAKATEAAQAAKVSADNAVRALTVNAPKMAATHAATAQAAANVAASVAKSPRAQQAAALAQSEATKAVAAANVCAKNCGYAQNGEAMGDWLELSGMGGMGGMGGSFLDTELGGGVKVKHVGLGLLLGAVGWFGYKKLKG